MINHRREVALTGLWHEYAAIFPMLDGEAQDGLRDDIQENGVREAVVVYEGKILDGRNRYLCARDLGLDFPVVDFDGTDKEALSFVISTNLHRRHLTVGQRAMIAARLSNLAVGSNQHVARITHDNKGGEFSTPLKVAAETLGIDRKTAQFGRAVFTEGAPELVAAVEKGEVSVSAAAAVSELPQEQQTAVVAEGPKAVTAAAKAVREAKKPVVQDAEPDDPATAKLRRELNGLTREALLDDLIAVKLARADDAAKIRAMKAEIETLKADLAAYRQDDIGRALGNAQRQARTAEGRMAEYQTTAVRADRKAKILEAENKKLRAELENQVIPL